MSFLNPTYLWALLGLLIPLIIHLWSKKEGKTIKVGSIKLLSEADSKQSSSIRLNEILLLVLRLGIVTILVLLIAQPVTKKKPNNSPVSYLVEPSLLKDNSFSKMIDSLSENAPVYLFSQGLSELEEDMVFRSEPLEYWSWTKQAQQLKTDSLVIFTKGYAIGVMGKRPSVRVPTEVIIVNKDEPQNKVLEVLKREDKVRLIKANTSFESTKISAEEFSEANIVFNASQDSIVLFEGATSDRFPVLRKKPIRVAFFTDAGFEAQQAYLEAALRTLSKVTWKPIEISKLENKTIPEGEEVEVVVWLSNASPSVDELPMLVYKPDALATMLIEPGESNTHYLTEALNSENIIERNLVENLSQFLELDADTEQKLVEADRRILDKSDIMPKLERSVEASVGALTHNLGLTKLLWIFLLLIMVGERLLANFRKQ